MACGPLPGMMTTPGTSGRVCGCAQSAPLSGMAAASRPSAAGSRSMTDCATAQITASWPNEDFGPHSPLLRLYRSCVY